MSAIPITVTDKLKTEFRFCTKEKLKNQRVELTLRNKERSLIDELTTVKAETEFMLNQIEDMKKQITELKRQVDMVEICETSERSKIANHSETLFQHKKGFDELFAQEKELLQRQSVQQHQTEANKKAKVLEIDEQMGAEADAIEMECEEIERECGVLAKRNRAIMLQLRRKLIKSETTRRELMKKMNTPPQ